MFKTFVFLCAIASVFAKPSNRIVGGSTAREGEFPHQISLRVNNQHICGGSIIGPSKILTAAHCIHENNQPMTVVVGTNHISQGGQAYTVNTIIPHPQYDPRTMLNDVAVLRLNGRISYNQLVKPIILRPSLVKPGETTILSGWGLTSYPGTAPYALQSLRMKSIDLMTCAKSLAGANPISTGNVCTTSPQNQGACKGDSGGPLIDENGHQIGVVSWGVPCAKGLPDVFTSVSYFNGWIQSIQ